MKNLLNKKLVLSGCTANFFLNWFSVHLILTQYHRNYNLYLCLGWFNQAHLNTIKNLFSKIAFFADDAYEISTNKGFDLCMGICTNYYCPKYQQASYNIFSLCKFYFSFLFFVRLLKEKFRISSLSTSAPVLSHNQLLNRMKIKLILQAS